MPYIKLLTIAILVSLLPLSSCQPIQPRPVATPTPSASAGATGGAMNEILWDAPSVPHIFAQDNASAFYAFGWAQMYSHGNLLLQLYAQSRGRAAEIYGEAYLTSDQTVRLLGIPELGEAWYTEQSPTFRTYLDAFVAGINDYAAQSRYAAGAA